MESGLVLRSLVTFLYLKSPEWLAGFFGSLIPLWHKDKYELEIIKNFRYSPRDKICLEYAKILCAKNEYKDAIPVLKGITTGLNADWRAVYRSFKLLSQIYKKLGEKQEEDRYMKLYFNCNSKASKE
jgi:hypothetical protein